MKFAKFILITLLATLFTGCYTQLQYSQKMKRITEKEAPAGYTQGYEEADNGEQVDSQAVESYGYETEDEDYIPIYYKDYAYEKGWADCGCNPYLANNYYGYDYYQPYLTLYPSYFYHRHPYRYYGHPYPYFGSRFSFSITFGWGSPYYYYDPFYYDPFYYDYYWYGYSPFAYNYFGYYGHHGYYPYYGHHGKSVVSNRRYGPRSIGTNRSNSSVGRTRDATRVSGRRGTYNSGSTTRTRSVGTVRTRSTSRTSSGSAVSPSRTRSRTQSSSGTTRSRSRGSANRDNHQQSVPDYRSRDNLQSQDRSSHSEVIRSRTYINNNSRVQREYLNRAQQNQRIQRVELNQIRQRQSRPTFLQRLGGLFENTGRFIQNHSTNSSVRLRAPSSSSSSRSSVSRSRSSGHSRSTVHQSRSRSSSSGHSRSRSSSSNSRGSSSSSRSRGHH